MTGGQGLSILAVGLQSVGKVLYGTFLIGISTPMFVLLSICLTGAVFLASVGFRLPREGRGLLALVNIWTAISFISVFFALKHLPPAIFASIEIGMSLLTAVALASVQAKARPRMVRILACIGILAGCALLSWAEIAAAMSKPTTMLVWCAILASTATGVASTLSATTCKQLASNGWTSTSVLAHRFYLTIAVAIAWLSMEQPTISVPDASTLAIIAMIGTVAILTPLLLLQIALRRADALSVMICMSCQPILSFLISLPSPAYDWNTLTLFGVLVVTVFVGLDILMQPKSVQAAPGTAARRSLATTL
jgi:drug/metabolite transporter (DMT)-like permease